MNLRERFAARQTGLWTRKRLVSVASFVLLLVVVLSVTAALSFPRATRDALPGTEWAADDRTDFLEAKRLYESGETTAALVLLEAYVGKNPADAEARDYLDGAIGPTQSGGAAETSQDSTSTVADPNTGDNAALARVANIEDLLPDAIPGWAPGVIDSMPENAGVPFDPVSTQAQASARRALFQVHDLGSDTGARAFLQKVSAVTFPNDAGSVRVGQVTAYYGTDGGKRATVAFARGPYAFELIVASNEISSADLQRLATGLAGGFPATR